MIARLLKYLFAGVLMLSRASAMTYGEGAAPDEMIRNLQAVQDDVAAGIPDALTMQNRALADMGASLGTTDLSLFKENRNVYALITYLFNGGNPHIVRSILENIPAGQISQRLVKGARAYADGRTDEFMQAFAPSVAEDAVWPEAVRLSIYLNTVAYMAVKNPDEASRRLDYVRLAAPGSLFEEAAIRRQFGIAARLGDIRKMRLLIRSYADRFAASPFADYFWSEMIGIVPHIDGRLTDADLDSLAELAPAEVRYLVYLYVARVNLVNGHMERSFYSAAQAERLARALEVDDSAARLYYAGSQAGSLKAAEAIKILQSIHTGSLDARDRFLFDAVQEVAENVVRGVAGDDLAAQPAVSPQSGVTLRQQDNAGSRTIDDFIEKGREELARIDHFLEETGE